MLKIFYEGLPGLRWWNRKLDRWGWSRTSGIAACGPWNYFISLKGELSNVWYVVSPNRGWHENPNPKTGGLIFSIINRRVFSTLPSTAILRILRDNSLNSKVITAQKFAERIRVCIERIRMYCIHLGYFSSWNNFSLGAPKKVLHILNMYVTYGTST